MSPKRTSAPGDSAGAYVKQKLEFNHTLTTCHFDRAWRTRAHAGPHDGAKRRSGNVRVSSDGEICSAAFPEAAGRATLLVDRAAILPNFWRGHEFIRAETSNKEHAKSQKPTTEY